MVYIDDLYLWINFEKSPFPDFTSSNFAYVKWVYVRVRISIQQFLQPLTMTISHFHLYTTKSNCIEATVEILFFYTKQVLSGSRVGLCRVELLSRVCLNALHKTVVIVLSISPGALKGFILWNWCCKVNTCRTKLLADALHLEFYLINICTISVCLS